MTQPLRAHYNTPQCLFTESSHCLSQLIMNDVVASTGLPGTRHRFLCTAFWRSWHCLCSLEPVISFLQPQGCMSTNKPTHYKTFHRERTADIGWLLLYSATCSVDRDTHNSWQYYYLSELPMWVLMVIEVMSLLGMQNDLFTFIQTMIEEHLQLPLLNTNTSSAGSNDIASSRLSWLHILSIWCLDGINWRKTVTCPLQIYLTTMDDQRTSYRP